jgi:vacuolar-type H+-ATPase subunit E/Vma4
MVQRKVDGTISNARVLARDIVESRKRELVDEVFKRARERVLALPDKDKKRLLEGMLSEAKEGIEHPKVIVDSSCAKYIRGVTNELGDFGFIVTDKEETIRVDCTLGSVLSRLKPAFEPDIAKMLFNPRK